MSFQVGFFFELGFQGRLISLISEAVRVAFLQFTKVGFVGARHVGQSKFLFLFSSEKKNIEKFVKIARENEDL